MSKTIIEINPSEYPLKLRLPQTDQDNLRIAQLYEAIEETFEFFFAMAFDRLDKMRSFWTAYEQDLEAILKAKWGELYDAVIETVDNKRLFLWLANELLYVKNSEFAISIATTRIGYPKSAVQWEKLYYKKDETYGDNYYTKNEALALSTLNGLDDFILTSKGAVTFDTSALSSGGVDINDIIKQTKRYFSKSVVPTHISLFLTVLAGNTARKVLWLTHSRTSKFKTTFIAN